METQFEIELEILINQHCIENGSDTPDWILAKYLQECLNNFNATVNKREEWYGRQKKISDLPEAGENIPIIDLDNETPIIDYDSTGIPPQVMPSQTTGADLPTTSHKRGIHPLGKKLDAQLKTDKIWKAVGDIVVDEDYCNTRPERKPGKI